MKFGPRTSDKASAIVDRRANNTHSVEGSVLTIPMRELALFAEGVLRENHTQVDLECPRMSAFTAAQKILRFRNEITAILDPLGLPISPVLDIILDLFTNERCERRVTVMDVGIAGHCSPTTGIRWITALMDAGIVEKTNDPADHRRTFVLLTTAGRKLVLDCIKVYQNDAKSETNGHSI